MISLQEVRGPDDAVEAALGEGWPGVHAESGDKVRAGVAVFSRTPLQAVRVGLGAGADPAEFATSGRPGAARHRHRHRLAHRLPDRPRRLGPLAIKAEIDRAATYAERWSDHAPVVVTYEL